jgi:flagellar basal-body rod protein FlgG
MIEGLYTAGSSMLPRNTRQDYIANNIANLEVPGFKRDRIFLRELGDAHKRISGGYPEWRNDRIAGSYIDFEQGIMQQTNNHLNFSVFGPGFFRVRTAQGDLYTRNGEWGLNAQGFLVANVVAMKDTRPRYVLNTANQPIQLPSQEFTVNTRGEILVNGAVVNQIAVWDIPKAAKDINGNYLRPTSPTGQKEGIMERNANGLFQVAAGAGVRMQLVDFAQKEAPQVMQGFLERSNANAVTEMVDMVESYRWYEADQKAVKVLDDTLNRSVNQVGTVRSV